MVLVLGLTYVGPCTWARAGLLGSERNTMVNSRGTRPSSEVLLKLTPLLASSRQEV